MFYYSFVPFLVFWWSLLDNLTKWVIIFMLDLVSITYWRPRNSQHHNACRWLLIMTVASICSFLLTYILVYFPFMLPGWLILDRLIGWSFLLLLLMAGSNMGSWWTHDTPFLFWIINIRFYTFCFKAPFTRYLKHFWFREFDLFGMLLLINLLPVD